MDTETRYGADEGSVHMADFVEGAALSMVLDHMTDGVLVCDRDGVIVYVNEPLLTLFGYRPGDLVGQPVEVLLPENARGAHRHQIEQFMAAPSPRSMGRDDLDIEGRRADGSHFSLDIQLSVLAGTSWVIATVRDVTALRHSTVDMAISRIDLANAHTRIDGLQNSLDLVVQRLFALGTWLSAAAASETMLTDRLGTSVQRINDVIEVVQERRPARGR